MQLRGDGPRKLVTRFVGILEVLVKERLSRLRLNFRSVVFVRLLLRYIIDFRQTTVGTNISKFVVLYFLKISFINNTAYVFGFWSLRK